VGAALHLDSNRVFSCTIDVVSSHRREVKFLNFEHPDAALVHGDREGSAKRFAVVTVIDEVADTIVHPVVAVGQMPDGIECDELVPEDRVEVGKDDGPRVRFSF